MQCQDWDWFNEPIYDISPFENALNGTSGVGGSDDLRILQKASRDRVAKDYDALHLVHMPLNLLITRIELVES